jgi:hypothetical protein
MDRISTASPTWQNDCEDFAHGGTEFELLNVVTPDHHRFVEDYCKAHNNYYVIYGTTARLGPNQSRNENSRAPKQNNRQNCS